MGVYFITQNPRDVPDNVLGQLGNRVQHALRAFTPRDQKAVQAAAETFRVNPKLDTAAALQELAVGEALVSMLDQQGQPGVVQRAWIVPPRSQIGPITDPQRQELMAHSVVAGVYDQVVDRESAYERLTAAHAATPAVTSSGGPTPPAKPGWLGSILGTGGPAQPTARGRGRPADSLATAMAKSAARSIGSTVGRELIRGVLGSIMGGGRRR